MRLTLVCILLLLLALWPSPAASAASANYNLSDFGAIGDGVTDDGPALQAAFDALAASGGGTLFVPAGRYAIGTPVSKDFSGLADSITIIGVESSTVVDNTGTGPQLSTGLNLVSEFLPRTGESEIAITVMGLQNFVVEHISFAGTPEVTTDAKLTLFLYEINDAVIRHCEFYTLSSLVPNGGIVAARRSGLTIEQSKFLGSTASSAHYTPVVQNLEWKSITVKDCTFLDYGTRELFSKTGYSAPSAWINVGNAAATDSNSPRREVKISNVFLDEVAVNGLSSLPTLYQPPSALIDLIYVSNLRMNVSNLQASGNYFSDVKGVMIEDARYGWSHNADSAINLLGVGNAIVDQAECLDHAYRIRADTGTGKLTVINSTYTFLDSEAQITNAFTTSTPEEDPVQFVRQQFETVLGVPPDAAGHYYWSNLILECGPDAQCVTDRQAELAAYLAGSPTSNFSIQGQVTDENGTGVSDVIIALTGSQSVTTQTGELGNYSFANLPTSGVYTVSASKQHYSFAQPVQTLVTPAGNQTVDFGATLDRYSISGHLADGFGNPVAEATVSLSGSQTETTTTNAEGVYTFTNLSGGGPYTVTPSKSSYRFAPGSNTIENLDVDRSVDFVLLTYTISGAVVRTDGLASQPVTIMLNGPEGELTTTTDSLGTYSFPNLPGGGNYTVTPALEHHSFDPAIRTFDNLQHHEPANFNTTPLTYQISGRLTANGASLSGATVTLAGSEIGVVTTNEEGVYSFDVTAQGNYSVTPSHRHYTFSPSNGTVNNLTAPATFDFAATLSQHAIAGRVADVNNKGFGGVTLTLSGSEHATTTTNSVGEYSFTNLDAGGDYVVTPSLVHHVFDNQELVFTDLDSTEYGGFVVSLAYHTISGRVTLFNGTPMSSATVTLSGSLNATTGTDSDGNYSFSNLPTARTYSVTLGDAKSYDTPGYTFVVIAADQTANFVRKAPPVLVSHADSTRALALDSILQTKEPFKPTYALPWSQDNRTRVVLFASNLELGANEGVEVLKVEAEDTSHRIYALKVEYVGTVPGNSWLMCIVVRLDDGLGDVGDVLVRLSLHGNPSNRVRLAVGHVGGGLPDDAGAVPTPAYAPQ